MWVWEALVRYGFITRSMHIFMSWSVPPSNDKQMVMKEMTAARADVQRNVHMYQHHIQALTASSSLQMRQEGWIPHRIHFHSMSEVEWTESATERLQLHLPAVSPDKQHQLNSWNQQFPSWTWTSEDTVETLLRSSLNSSSVSSQVILRSQTKAAGQTLSIFTVFSPWTWGSTGVGFGQRDEKNYRTQEAKNPGRTEQCSKNGTMILSVHLQQNEWRRILILHPCRLLFQIEHQK